MARGAAPRRRAGPGKAGSHDFRGSNPALLKTGRLGGLLRPTCYMRFAKVGKGLLVDVWRIPVIPGCRRDRI